MDMRGKELSAKSRQQQQQQQQSETTEDRGDTGPAPERQPREGRRGQDNRPGRAVTEGVTTRSRAAKGASGAAHKGAGEEAAGSSSTRRGLRGAQRGRGRASFASSRGHRSSLRNSGSQYCVEVAPEDTVSSSVEAATRNRGKDPPEGNRRGAGRARKSPGSLRGLKRRNSSGDKTLDEGSNRGKRPRRDKNLMDSRPGSSRDMADNREDEGPSSADSGRGANTIKGLLNRLSSGFDELLPSAMPGYSSLKQLLVVLKSSSDDFRRAQALTELCDILSVGTEEAMAALSVDLFVPQLIELLGPSNSADVRLLAALALSHMMDALPASTAIIAHNGAAVPLCASLHAIEYIDLAEQALSALRKLSVDHSQAIVRAGGFAAALNFFDFFSIGLQRVSASLACNLCQNTPADAFPMVVEVLPVFTMLLDSDDQRIRESAMLSFSRLVDSFKQDSGKLEIICGPDFVLLEKTIYFVTSPQPAKLAPQAFASAMRMLGLLARGSADLSMFMLGRKDVLEGLKAVLQSISSPYSLECLSVAESLLPFGLEIQEDEELSKMRRGKGGLSYGSASTAVEVAKRKHLAENPSLLVAYGNTLFICLLNNLNSSVNLVPKRITLLALAKFVHNAPAEILNKLIVSGEATESSTEISAAQFSSHVASLLGENNSSLEVVAGLALISSTMDKLPNEVRGPFIREGVLHQLQRLSSMGPEAKSVAASEERTSSQMEVEGSVKESTAAVAMVTDDTPAEEKRDKEKEKEKEKGSSSSRGGLDYTVKKARAILEKHFAVDGKDLVCEGKELKELKKLAKKLASTHETGEMKSVMEELAEALSSEHGMSTFELNRSGLLDALLTFFDGNGSLEAKLERLELFAGVFARAKSVNAFSVLVARVYGVLSAEDKLVVCVNETSSGTISAASGLRQLGQPLKLRLKRCTQSEGGSNLRDYSHNVVVIDPMATILSLEDFLWPRVKTQVACNALSMKFARNSQRQNAANVRPPDFVAGDRVQSLLDEDEDEQRGVLGIEEEDDDDDDDDEDEDGGEEGHESHAMESSASDDEVDSDEDDVDDDENDDMSDDAEDFGAEHMGTSLPPVELDLDRLSPHPKQYRGGNPPDRESSRGGAGAGARGGGGGVSGSPRSYAAAVASEGHPSRSRQGGEGLEGDRRADQSREKLVFKLGNEPINREKTILQGVLSQASRTRELMNMAAGDNHHPHHHHHHHHHGHGSSGRRIGSRIWDEVHTLTYFLGSGETEEEAMLAAKDESGTAAPTQSVEAEPAAMGWARVNEHAQLPIPLSGGLDQVAPRVRSIIRVAQYLHCVNKYAADLSTNMRSSFVQEDSFVSNSLTGKLLRQISDPLALCGGMIPPWIFALSTNAQFLLPFDARLALLQSTALGITRALHRLQARADAMAASGGGGDGRGLAFHHDGDGRMGRILRRKVKIERARALESAVNVMANYSTDKSMIEIEYYNEAGTGLGPTLEFYTMVSRELQRADLNLWRSKSTVKVSRSESEYKLNSRRRSRSKSWNSSATANSSTAANQAPPLEAAKESIVEYIVPTGDGVFPLPLPQGESKEVTRVLDLFRFLGRLCGKVLTDGRLLDLRMSPVFAELIVASAAKAAKKEEKLRRVEDYDLEDARFSEWDLRSLAVVDPVLANSLQDLIKIRGGIEQEAEDDPIADLCLSFVMPGNEKIELETDGRSLAVTKHNVDAYVRAVTKYLLFTGVKRQAAEFVAGFGEVLDTASLLYFQPEELNMIFCGPESEEWTTSFLVHSTRCDHGYSHESTSVVNLLRILSELDGEDQRKFLQFATGSPRLPVGGLGNLQPRLTIVRRTPEPGQPIDESLPTVMTCTNYLKLPDYSSIEITRERLLFAIREGQGSFDLS